MNDVQRFLEAAAARAGVSSDVILARVLHENDDAIARFASTIKPELRPLFDRLDRELRLRNPGLHYVERKMFLGYRREGPTISSTGERSQIFVSVMRHGVGLEVVLPVDADSVPLSRTVRDLRGLGHHGIGDVKVTISSQADVERFLDDFEYWLSA